ncbi:TPA: hypothetical protein ACS772_002461 [Providencia alcalifaciens]
MKKKSVLIYGEFSGYGKSLAQGFRELGYDSEVFSFNGDGFKKINSGLNLKGSNKLLKLISIIKLLPKLLKYKNILIMNPAFFNMKFLGPFILTLFKITRKNIILLCCGDDVEFIRQGKNGNIQNWPYYDINLPSKNHYSKPSDLFVNYLVATFSKKLIPAMYDYHKAWSLSKYSKKLTETIPLACDGKVKTIKKKNFNDEKIIIMHGINREDFKGTKKIKKALLEIEKKYKSEVEIIMPEKLPLSEYLSLMDNVDISIDQTKCNSYGMNAAYSMLAGHIVLAPANQNFRNDLNIEECPIISINNDENDIFNAIEKIILNKNSIQKIKEDTQKYAIEIHSPRVVASKIDHYLL